MFNLLLCSFEFPLNTLTLLSVNIIRKTFSNYLASLLKYKPQIRHSLAIYYSE